MNEVDPDKLLEHLQLSVIDWEGISATSKTLLVFIEKEIKVTNRFTEETFCRLWFFLRNNVILGVKIRCCNRILH